MTETLRDGLTGSPCGAGDLVRWRGRTLVIDSWSCGAGVVRLRSTLTRGVASLHTVVEVKAEQIGCYVGFYYRYDTSTPRWARCWTTERQAPDFDSYSPWGLKLRPLSGNCNVWRDTLKPGETRDKSSDEWFASVAVSGHIRHVKSGFWTEQEAKDWARKTDSGLSQ